jgi:hypothetical protein
MKVIRISFTSKFGCDSIDKKKFSLIRNVKKEEEFKIEK